MPSPVQSTMGKAIDKPPVEGKVRIYYIDGTAHDCWPVDAGEAVSGGVYSYTPPATDEEDHDSRHGIDGAASAETEDQAQGKEAVSTSTTRRRSKR